MVNLRPFRATYFASQNLAELISPPYDVISPALQQNLYARDPHNFVRIDFGQPQADDTEDRNVYTRAAQTLQQWLAQGVFQTDQQPAYYLHTQTFEAQGVSHQRRDLFALCEATPFTEAQVLPHERTLDGPKADRFKLMQATQSHLSPVFSIYQDPEQQLAGLLDQVQSQTALYEFTDHDGLRHSLHAISEPQTLEAITAFFADRPLYIADGHHRYETALKFRQQYGAEIEAANYVCMYLSALEDPGLLVLPYQRLIRASFNWPEWEGFMAELGRYFEVRALDFNQIETDLAEQQPGQMSFVMQTPQSQWHLSRPAGLPDKLATDRAQSYRSLDVSVLHELLLYKLAGFPKDKAKDPDYIQFSPDISVLQATLASEGGVAFYLHATPVSALCEVAEQGETMPPKSTYFYPKVPSGLLFTRFESAF